MTKREQEMRAEIKELLDKYSGEAYGSLSDYEVTTLIALKAAEWVDSHPSEVSIAKFLYEKKGFPISLNGDIPSFEEAMKDIKQYYDYEWKQWIDSHPVNQWHKVSDGLPPCLKESSISNVVLITNGYSFSVAHYIHNRHIWSNECHNVTHWMELPELPKED